MWGLKRGAALLLPALTNSLVLPSDQLSRPVDHFLPEGPALRLPFVYEYHAKHEASITFTLQTEDHDASLEQPESELISVIIPRSDATACSDESDTHIRVNGQNLLSTGQQVVDSQVVQRSGASAIPIGAPHSVIDQNTALSSWTLQCACLDVLSSLWTGTRPKCEQYGYILNVQPRSSITSELGQGFTLSFIQSTQPKLLRLTSLAVSTLDASKSIVQDLANSRHWLAPLLHPIDTIIGEVPTSTLSQLLPKFSTTSAQSFRTITTPLAPITTQPAVLEASPQPDHLPPIPSPQSEWLPLSTSLASQDELGDSVQHVQHDEVDDFALYNELEAAPARKLDEWLEAKEGINLQQEEPFPHYSAIEDPWSRGSPGASESKDPESGSAESTESLGTASDLRLFLIGAGRRAQKTLHAVIGHIAGAKNVLQMDLPLDRVRNETREFHEDLQLDGPFPEIPAIPEVSFQHVLAVSLCIFTAVGGTIFACVRYRDPRRRAERAARREEQLNRRLYKKAVFRHKFQNWFNHLRGRETYQTQSETFAQAQMHMRNPAQDLDPEWHDKDEGLVGSHAPNIHGVHKGIGELREAHGFVEGILRATSGMYRGSRLRGTSRGSRNRRYSDVGSEKSMLPPYTPEDECEEHIVVVDGLHFPIRRRRDATPASSIIATSPQESDCGSSDGEKE